MIVEKILHRVCRRRIGAGACAAGDRRPSRRPRRPKRKSRRRRSCRRRFPEEAAAAADRPRARYPDRRSAGGSLGGSRAARRCGSGPGPADDARRRRSSRSPISPRSCSIRSSTSRRSSASRSRAARRSRRARRKSRPTNSSRTSSTTRRTTTAAPRAWCNRSARVSSSTRSGLIVTNNHVIADADEIVANFADGSQLTAELVGVDEKTDLALLKVEPVDTA